MVQEGNVTADTFIELQKRLLRGAEKPTIPVVDGHFVHKAKSVKPLWRNSSPVAVGLSTAVCATTESR